MDQIELLKAQVRLAELPDEALYPMLARARWRLKAARSAQLPPSNQLKWHTWLLKAGRGFGKTRSAVEWMWWEAWNDPGSFNHAVVRRSEDLERVAFEGPSGFFRVIPQEAIADKVKSPYRIRLKNDALILGFSADDPDVLRGPECHRTWADELAAWRRLDAAWNDGVMFGTRLGSARNCGRPKKIITTTPRPIKLLRELMDDPMTVMTEGSTYENAENLSPELVEAWRKKYAGTRRGRQELGGELLEDVPGALWLAIWIEETRIWEAPVDLMDVVVAVDPPASSEEGSNECGLVAAGRDRAGRGYVLADRSEVMSPEDWGAAAVLLHDEVKADHITVEVNQGGEMCRTVLTTAALRLRAEGKRRSGEVVVRTVHASRGKEIRAEPVSQFYEQRRISHVGEFPQLEDQLTNFTKGYDRRRHGSPDRLDALVWAFTDLLVEAEPSLVGSVVPQPGTSQWAPGRVVFWSGNR